MKRLLATTLGALALSVGALVAAGTPALAEWPERPIKVIVPYSPGGSPDQLTRKFAAVLAENNILPEPVNVVNVQGHFSVGATEAKNAKPDGYTFLFLHAALMSAEVVNPDSGVSWRNYDPVAKTSNFGLTIVTHADQPYTTLPELMEATAQDGHDIKFGVNLGAINHLTYIDLMDAWPGSDFKLVQAGGGGKQYPMLKGGQLQAGIMTSQDILTFQDPDIRVLGYSGPARLGALPDTPTFREQGIEAGITYDYWWFAPVGTPSEAIEGFAAALEKAIQTDDMKNWLEAKGLTDDFLKGELLQADLETSWEKIVPIANKAKAALSK